MEYNQLLDNVNNALNTAAEKSQPPSKSIIAKVQQLGVLGCKKSMEGKADHVLISDLLGQSLRWMDAVYSDNPKVGYKRKNKTEHLLLKLALIQAGDLPSGYEGAPIKDTYAEDFLFRSYDQLISKKLTKNQKNAGEVLVIVYPDAPVTMVNVAPSTQMRDSFYEDTAKQINRTYTGIVNWFDELTPDSCLWLTSAGVLHGFGEKKNDPQYKKPTETLLDIGDRCTVILSQKNKKSLCDLVFIKNNLVVRVLLKHTSDVDAVIGYAKRLNAKLDSWLRVVLDQQGHSRSAHR